MSGIALARAGQQVAIISAGQSALHFSSGSFELYGGTESPLEGIATLPEEHPYRKLGLERVARYAVALEGQLLEFPRPASRPRARPSETNIALRRSEW